MFDKKDTSHYYFNSPETANLSRVGKNFAIFFKKKGKTEKTRVDGAGNCERAAAASDAGRPSRVRT